MKKYWRIQNTSDIKQCLQKLNVDSNYIEILLEDDSDFMRYLNDNPKYVYITYKDSDHKYYQGNIFGWIEEEFIDYYSKKEDWQFCGEINMRKEKLKKLNGDFR